MEPSSSRPGLLDRLSALLSREPEDRGELIELLHAAYERRLFDADALTIIEGALSVGDMQVRDVMVPRSQMSTISINEPIDQIISYARQTSHSRFPVVGENKDDVLGILLAKDLLHAYGNDKFNLRETLRPAIFIPEAKRLNVLLREFRANRNHMALVVDEYGGISGLVTIEDVLEQIVGDIDDEYDFDPDADNIVSDQSGRYRVKATTELEDFNKFFGTEFAMTDADTIGGEVIRHLGHLPARGEVIELAGLRFQVLRADSRRIYTLLVERIATTTD